MIIRGQQPNHRCILSPSGEVYEEEQKEGIIESLFQEECREAFQKGVKEGEHLGYEKAQIELESLFHLSEKIVQKILEFKNLLLEQMKPEVVEFALRVCEQTLRQELSCPETLVNLINSLIARSTGAWQGELLLVYLSPNDLVMMDSHLAKVHYDKREVKGVRFIPDASIKEGNLRIEANRALLNFDLARELSDLKSKVLHN